MSNLRQKIEKLTTLSPLMENRTKGDLEQVCGQPLTWNNVDVIELESQYQKGQKDHVPVLHFAEYPDNFFFGGQQFSSICEELEVEDIEDLKTNGIQIMLSRIKTKNGQTFTKLELI